MKTVVRIEHKSSGIGIFRSDAVEMLSNSNDFKWRHSNFPTPICDTLVGEGKISTKVSYLDIRADKKEWLCSFKSISQLNEWVTPNEIKEFIGMGFKVFSITTEVYQEGNYQIIFSKEDILTKK